MPTNKNALRRLKILDELLSHPVKRYSRQELYNIVLEKLTEYDGEASLSKRTIEKDIQDIQNSPFCMEIIEEQFNGKSCLRYANPTQSLFAKKLSDEEKVLLREVLNTLGQFSGLDSFEWLESLQTKLNDPESMGSYSDGFPKERNQIISFSRNPYLNNQNGVQDISNFLQVLFTAIASKSCASIDYRKFDGPVQTFIVYPYLLKQYNDRWYLICGLQSAEADFVMNLPLDRMTRIELLPQISFRDCAVDLEDRFSRIIGVTFRTDSEETPIVFAVSKEKAPYIRTKPMHETQKEFTEDRQSEFHALYPTLSDYVFFEIECIPNNELMDCMFSFDKDIVVVSPLGIRDALKKELSRQKELYEAL